MARVIKAGAGQAGARPARPATRVLAQADMKKVIEKELFLARQEAEELLKRAEEERREILAEGRQLAARAREEAMTRGASQAFAAAAEEALSAFRARADRYDEAADDIRILATEIACKLLGTPPDLSAGDIERILKRGLEQLRARRKVRVLVPTGRRADLAFERPHLMKAVDAQPDILIEEAADVGPGFARVVTEVGGALCAEDSAMEALAQTVNVKEAPRPRGESAGHGATHVGPAPSGRQRIAAPTADFEDVDDEGAAFSAAVNADDPDRSEILVRPDIDDLSSLADEPELPSVSDLEDLDELPDAVIEEDDEDDRTRALPAPLPRAPRPGALARALPSEPTAPLPAKRSAIVKAGTATPTAGRRPAAATRVLALDAQAELRNEAKRGAQRVDLGADDEDDLDLYTDRRPGRR